MIIINPLTFAEMRIDETQITVEQAELLKRISRRLRRIGILYGKQYMDVFKIEMQTKMKFMDVLDKIKM